MRCAQCAALRCAVRRSAAQWQGRRRGEGCSSSPWRKSHQPPDDKEDARCSSPTTWTSDQRYFSASPVQKTLNAWVQGEARHSRGGENVGGGFWRYAPTHFVQLGGAADTVGVEPLVACEPQRTYGCERGVFPVHKWNGVHALGTAGLARTYESSHTRARGAPARAILCIRESL